MKTLAPSDLDSRPVRFSAREFLAPFISGGLLSITRLMTGLVRIKYASLVMGAAGVGLMSQGNQLQLLGITLGSMGFVMGLTNRVLSSEREGDPTRIERTLPTAFTTQMLFTSILVAMGFIFRKQLAISLFGDANHSLKVALVIASVPFSIVATGYMEGVLLGKNRYDLVVIASVVATVLGLVAFLVLVKSFGVIGAFWAYVSSSVFLSIFLTIAALKLVPLTLLIKLKIDRAEFTALFGFSSLMLIIGAFGYAVAILIRARVIHAFGTAANGILQAALAFTAYYTPFLTNGLWGRLRPMASTHGETEGVHQELLRNIRLVAVGQAIAAVLILTFPELLLRFAYTSEFLPAIQMISIQMVGDSFYFLAFTYSVYLLGIGQVRSYFLGWLIYYSLQAIIVVVGTAHFGVWVVPAAHVLASATVAAISWVLIERDIHRLHQKVPARSWSIGGCIVMVMGQAYLLATGHGLLVRLISASLFASILAYLEWDRIDRHFLTRLKNKFRRNAS